MQEIVENLAVALNCGICFFENVFTVPFPALNVPRE
jgi:hypothetical protein